MKPTRIKPTQLGDNRTGIATSPEEAKRTRDGARQGVKDASPDARRLFEARLRFSKQAPPVGTLPQLANGREVPTIFIDQLGGRLAFERTGARLYELLMVKLKAGHPHEGGPTLDELEHIREEELEHLGVTMRALEELGADPTAITPMGNISTVNGSGILKNLADPRVTLTEALDSVLIAELTDNETWAMLMTLALKLGRGDLAREFHHVLEQEQDHLEKIRTWLNVSISGQAGLEAPAHGQHPGAPSLQ